MTLDTQKKLSARQVTKFYHDVFVQDQMRDFGALAAPLGGRGVVVDVGDGVGYFAERVCDELGCPDKVIDMDPKSVAQCEARAVPAQVGDALAPPISGDEGCTCFNLILHHLVAQSEAQTRTLQIAALAAWRERGTPIFVNEYIYKSFVYRISGRLIYAITSSRILSAIAGCVARVIPAFKANTFGVGVRFRAHDEWLHLFHEAGLSVQALRKGEEEEIKLSLRLLLIKTIRRDSFLLRTASSAHLS